MANEFIADCAGRADNKFANVWLNTMAQIAEYFAVHYMTVSRAVRSFEGNV